MLGLVHCDKCGSHNVDEVCIDENLPAQPQDLSMSEYAREGGFRGARVVPAIMKYHNYKLMCRACGYEIEYSS